MQTYEDSTNDGVMIAFLPTDSDWCKIDLPHMTLVYAGQKDQLKPADFNSLTKDAASLAMLTNPFALKVVGVDVFGSDGEQKVDVLRFRTTPELQSMRRFVEQWNKSEYPFNPHATVGPTGGTPLQFPQDTPWAVAFNRLVVAWGEDQIVFWLKNSSSY